MTKYQNTRIAWRSQIIFSIPKVLVVGETRDMAHAAEMVRVLKEKYTNLSFTGHGDALGKVMYSKYYSVFYNFISPSKELCT